MKMRSVLGVVAATILVASQALAVPATGALVGEAGSMADGDGLALQQPPPMTETLRASYGCFVSGIGGTTAALLLGPQNLVNVVAGGIVVPAGVGVLAMGVFGVVFASFCTVGQALTPMALDLSERLAGPVEQASQGVARSTEFLSESLAPAHRLWRDTVAMISRRCEDTPACSRLALRPEPVGRPEPLISATELAARP